MRVYVIEASGKGGLIHYAYHLARAFQRVGLETTLVTSTDYELRDLAHEFRVVELLKLWDPRGKKAGNPLARKARRAWRGVQYVLEWLRLVRFLRREQPEAIVFGEMRFGFEAQFLRLLRRPGLLLVDVVHDVEPYDTSRDKGKIVAGPEQIAAFQRIYEQYDILLVHDQSNYQRFLELYRIDPAKVFRIFLPTNDLMLEVRQEYTPEALRERFGIAAGQPVVLFFGTITKYKGLEDLLYAFPQVQQQTGARLVVAGFPAKDVDPEALHAIADELGIAAHIAWYLDYVPNEWVATLMAISDVVVLPYRAITQSAVIQIAYACGRPVVATRVGGLPDVVEEGRSGLLVEPHDPDSLAQAIISLLGAPEKLAAYGAYARQLAEQRFSWQTLAEQIRKILTDRAGT